MVHALWRQFPRINLKLIALEPYLLNAVNISNQPIHHKIVDLLKSGGKFLRPGSFTYTPSLANPSTRQSLKPVPRQSNYSMSQRSFMTM